jgi:hypothetical protein
LDEYLTFGYEKDAKGKSDWKRDKDGNWVYIGAGVDRRSQYKFDKEWHDKEKKISSLMDCFTYANGFTDSIKLAWWNPWVMFIWFSLW